MSERFTKLFSLRENLYVKGAPVVIAAGALHKDNQADRIIAQIKIRSISSKKIRVTVTVVVFIISVAVCVSY